ncbi:conserved hypothetical protein [Rhizobium sp. EC-SD404]|nr:conserved hypothetical protein [Rhizobium sp. EC-SD404]
MSLPLRAHRVRHNSIKLLKRDEMKRNDLMIIRKYSIMALAAVSLALPATGLAVAQEAAPAQPQAEQPMAEQYSDDTLRSFATAFLQVDEVNREYTPRLQEATTPEEQEQIQAEASQQMVSIVEGSDVTVQEYTSIMQAAQADPALAEKLTQYIGEASGSAPAPAE